MLAKLGRALGSNRRPDEDNSRPNTPNYYSPAPNSLRERQMSVSEAVRQAHPNLSIFQPTPGKNETNDVSDHEHNDDEDDTAPPPSPSKRSFRTFFKRSSKIALDMYHPSESTSKMSLPIPKKVRTKVQDNTFEPPTDDSKSVSRAPRMSHDSTGGVETRLPRSILRTPGEPRISDAGSARHPTTSTPSAGQSVRFFSRDAYNDDEFDIVSPKPPPHSRSASRSTVLNGFQELGEIKRSSMDSTRRTDTISLLDKLREEGKMESPSNTTTFAAAQEQPADLFNGSADPFSGEKDAPSMIPFPGEGPAPRPSMDSSKTSIRSSSSKHHRRDASHDLNQQPAQTSHSIEIPTGMPNLLDSYPGEAEEPLLPEISMSEGLYGEIQDEMKHSAWLPEALSQLEEQSKAAASNAGTIRQRSYTMPFSPGENGNTIYHSMAESTPAMERVLRFQETESPQAIDFPAVSSPPAATKTISPSQPPVNAPLNTTLFFTPKSAPPDHQSFGLDLRRTESDPVLPPTKPPKDISHTHIATELFGTEDSLISSLRSQLMVQTSLVSHYEAELTASQSLVTSLTERLRRTNDAFEKYKDDGSKRKDAMTRLKRKVRELEGMVEEAEGERSQRSVLDECTAGAMVVLQERCQKAEDKWNHECKKREEIEVELETLRECLEGFNATHSMIIERPDFDTEEIEELKAKIAELETLGQERESLESQLENIKAENEELKAAAAVQVRSSSLELHNVEVDNLREIIRETSQELEDIKKAFDLESAIKDGELADLKKELESHRQIAGDDTDATAFLKQTVQKRDEEIAWKQHDLERMTQDYQALEARCHELEEGWKGVEEKRLELENVADNATVSMRNIELERKSLNEQLRHEKNEVGRLSRAVGELQNDLQQLDEERRFAVDDAERLKQNLRNREQEMTSDNKRFVSLSHEKDDLAAEVARLRKENAKLQNAQQRQRTDVTSRETELKQQVEELVKRRAEEEVARESLETKLRLLQDEATRYNKKIGEMNSVSADKEIEIADLRKARVKDQEDKEGLEIALQAKQQELELIKRKLQVRGVTENTPLSKAVSRRETMTPSAFATPLAPPAHPSSVLSNSTQRAPKEPAPLKHRASLALSPRSLNADSPIEPVSVRKARLIETTMSPPTSRRLSINAVSSIPSAIKSPGIPRSASRSSIASSVGPSPRNSLILNASTSTPLARKPSIVDTPRTAMRVKSSTRTKAGENDNTKENVAPSPITLKRKVAIVAA